MQSKQRESFCQTELVIWPNAQTNTASATATITTISTNITSITINTAAPAITTATHLYYFWPDVQTYSPFGVCWYCASELVMSSIV